MSLFENDDFHWRETYFVLFDSAKRPGAQQMQGLLGEYNPRCEVRNLQVDDDGSFESLTVFSPDDFAAMDITFMSGDEVREQADQLAKDLKNSAIDADEQEKAQRLRGCDARFEVYHFEQITSATLDDEDEMLDPGSLLGVLEQLADLCDGVAIDPQSGAAL